MKVSTLTMLGKLRVVFAGNKRFLVSFTLSRSGSVWTGLYMKGSTRSKLWTSRRDHRKRMARMAAHKNGIGVPANAGYDDSLYS